MMIAMGQVYFTPEDTVSNIEIYIPYPKYYKLSTIPHIRLWESSSWDKKSLVTPPTSVSSPIESKNTYNGIDFKDGSFLASRPSLFNSGICNIYMVYKINERTIPNSNLLKFPLENCLFGTVGLLRSGSADISQSSHEGRGIAFDAARGHNTKRGVGKNVVIFGVDNSHALNPENKKT